MDKITSEINILVNQYLKKLRENNIRIEKAVIFGSRVDNCAKEWSDIDIALVSDDFEGIRYKDKDKIRKITLSVSPMLSPLPFKTVDFSEEDPFVRHILKTGRTLVDARSDRSEVGQVSNLEL